MTCRCRLKSSTGAVFTTSAALVKGIATVPLPKRAPGGYALTARFAGDGNVGGSVRTVAVTVAKVAATVRAAWTRKPTGARAGGVRITVSALGVKPTGIVTVQVKNAKDRTVRSVRVRLSAAGTAVAALPRLAKGRYTLTATYAGSAQVGPQKYTLKFATARR
ncbi:hypothetical protein G5V59_23710 [Nocardioides sp. W3-2-3]|nr:hypothetical protein [Nocardioides convexus]